MRRSSFPTITLGVAFTIQQVVVSAGEAIVYGAAPSIATTNTSTNISQEADNLPPANIPCSCDNNDVIQESTSSSASKTSDSSSPGLLIRPIERLYDISVEEWMDEHSPSEVAVPVIFHSATDDTFDPDDWTREAIMEECGDVQLIDEENDDCTKDIERAAADEDCHSVQFVNASLIGEKWAGLQTANLTELNISTMADLLRLQNIPEGKHLYLHDAKMAHYCPPKVEKIRVPKYFPLDYRTLENDPDKFHDINLRNFHFPDIFISNKGTGSPLHADAHMTRFYFKLLSGKKLWRIIPPSENWRASPSDTDDYYPTRFEADIMQPDFETFPDLDGALVYEAILSPGDVLFCPEGWAHQVYNIEASIATSLNFVDEHALPAYLRHKLYEDGAAFQKSYSYRLLTSYLMPLDFPQRENMDEDVAVEEWIYNHHYVNMDVPESVENFVEDRKKFKGGIDAYRTHDGFPALHIAAMANFPAVTDYLLQNGASLYEKDHVGRTAMYVAERLEHWRVADELEWWKRERGSEQFREYIDLYSDSLF